MKHASFSAMVLGAALTVISTTASSKSKAVVVIGELPDAKLALVLAGYGTGTCQNNGDCGKSITQSTACPSIVKYYNNNPATPQGVYCTSEGAVCNIVEVNAGQNIDCNNSVPGQGCAQGTSAPYCVTKTVSTCKQDYTTGFPPIPICNCNPGTSKGVGTHDTCEAGASGGTGT